MAMAAPLLLAACTDIWNAGDLAISVRDGAVEQGCQRETIELDDWYTEGSGGNVWHGSCGDTEGNEKSFGINVDAVWKPSKPATRAGASTAGSVSGRRGRRKPPGIVVPVCLSTAWFPCGAQVSGKRLSTGTPSFC